MDFIRSLINEDGRIVKGVNTTVDVDVDQTRVEAGKFGNDVSIDGKPALTMGQMPKWTAMERAIIEGGHCLEDIQPKVKLFDFDKY
jgi:hypothetical protein|tara:strand:- start:1774 stop:2031 length:258 start_codon:yes stop_codon:yes gene_type:complete